MLARRAARIAVLIASILSCSSVARSEPEPLPVHHVTFGGKAPPGDVEFVIERFPGDGLDAKKVVAVEGAYTLAGFSPGLYRTSSFTVAGRPLVCEAVVLRVDDPTETGAEARAAQDLALPALVDPGSIRVVDPRGEPVRGAGVFRAPTEGAPYPDMVLESELAARTTLAVTGSDGSVRLPWIAGAFGLRVLAMGFELQMVPVGAANGAAPGVVRLKPAGRLEVRVDVPFGAPAGALVLLCADGRWQDVPWPEDLTSLRLLGCPVGKIKLQWIDQARGARFVRAQGEAEVSTSVAAQVDLERVGRWKEPTTELELRLSTVDAPTARTSEIGLDYLEEGMPREHVLVRPVVWAREPWGWSSRVVLGSQPPGRYAVSLKNVLWEHELTVSSVRPRFVEEIEVPRLGIVTVRGESSTRESSLEVLTVWPVAPPNGARSGALRLTLSATAPNECAFAVAPGSYQLFGMSRFGISPQVKVEVKSGDRADPIQVRFSRVFPK